MNFKKDRKGVSIMIGYILLISFAVIMSVFVYQWLKTYVPVETLECPDGVSVFVEKACCSPTQLNLTLKNNGRFNVDGHFIRATNDTRQELATLDISKHSKTYINSDGIVFFVENGELSPNEKIDEEYDLASSGLGELKTIEITPIRFQEVENKKVFVSCGNAKIKENLNCSVGSFCPSDIRGVGGCVPACTGGDICSGGVCVPGSGGLPTSSDKFFVEAEDPFLTLSTGFVTGSNCQCPSPISGNDCARNLNGAVGNEEFITISSFPNASGEYNITVSYCDGDGNQGTTLDDYNLYVNGIIESSWSSINDGTLEWVEKTTTVRINTGDEVKVGAIIGDSSSYTRIDFINITGTGGGGSPPGGGGSPTSFPIFYENFENGWDTVGGHDCGSVNDCNRIGNFNNCNDGNDQFEFCTSSNNPHAGTYGLLLEDWDTGGAITNTNGIWYNFDGSTACGGNPCNSITVNAWIRENNLGSGDRCWITEQYSGGTPSAIETIDSSWSSSWTESANSLTNPASANINVRIMCSLSSGSEEVYIDEFNITGWS